MNSSESNVSSEPDDFARWSLDLGEGSELDLPESEYDFESKVDSPETSFAESYSSASFDALAVMHLVAKRSKPGRVDIHVLAYLACLLSVFDGWPASIWGYQFSAVPPTLPFSPLLNSALDDCLTAGLIARGDSNTEILEITPDGRAEHEFLVNMKTLAPRLPYLSAASATTVLYSLPAVLNSVSREPQLQQAAIAGTPRLLLDRLSSDQLYKDFEILQAVMKDLPPDLVVPASLYLRFLEARDAMINGEVDEL